MSESVRVVCPRDNAVNRVPSSRLGDNPKCARCHQPLFTGKPVELDTTGFEAQLKKSTLPLLVDFWAPWCGPCIAMAPAYEEAARQLEPQMRVAKLNTEKEGVIASRHGIRSIPTMILFEGGREVARQSGAMATPGIVGWARGALRSTAA